MPMRRCAAPRCPHLVPVGTSYCVQHAKAYEAKRGTPASRGYNRQHRALRSRWAALIANGSRPICPRCGQQITPQQVWDLGHPTGRDGPMLPEHAACNRSEGGKRGNQARQQSARAD